MNTPKRYHPALVTLHWLIALLIFTDLYIGYFYIRPILMLGHGGVPGTDLILKIHMAAGVAILVLLIIRFIIRLTTRKPAPATQASKRSTFWPTWFTMLCISSYWQSPLSA